MVDVEVGNVSWARTAGKGAAVVLSEGLEVVRVCRIFALVAVAVLLVAVAVASLS
jgi:hypothetical protein